MAIFTTYKERNIIKFHELKRTRKSRKLIVRENLLVKILI